ncbi:MAG: oligosaccharide flippase family protein [Anaerolineales bacterium]|nr:oligosaccharide flippase family protein [Anaerolineales bacterium]MCB8951770.1 oligosaccharide flippase family protein [Ardenticatenales bacterium]
MPRQSKLKSTIIVSIGSLTNLIVGLVAQAVIAAQFGAGPAVDAYFTALVIPSTLVSIFLVSLNLIFIPVFIDAREQHGEEVAWRMVSYLSTNLITLLLLLSLGLYAFSPAIVRLVGYGYDAPTQALAARLNQLLTPMILFNAIWTIATSLLQALDRFNAAVAGLAFGNAAYIVSLIFLARGFGVDGLAVALVLNHVFICIGVLFALRDKLPLWRPRFGFADARFRKLLGLWSVLFSTSIFRRLNPAVQRALASQTGAGSVSYLSYGSQMVRAIDQLLLNSVATVLFPTIARDISVGDRESAKNNLMLAVRLNAFIIIPAVFGIAVVREPVVRLLLQRGAFSPENTAQVSLALLFSSGLLINSMVGTVTSKALYSLKAVWFLAFLSIINIVGLVLLSRLFMPRFGYLGIALADSVNLTWPWHLLYLRRRLGRLGLVSLGGAFARYTLLSLVMAGGAYGAQWLLAAVGVRQDWLLVVVTGLVGLVVYVGGAALFRFPEMALARRTLRRGRKGDAG